MTAMRNPDAKHIDFADLIGLIPSNPRFLPSNLDMVLERKGSFLVGEWKRPNESISRGQEILLENLAKKPGFLVVLIEGNTDEGMEVSKVQLFNPHKGWIEWGDNKESLKDLITQWYARAERKVI
jgi:hypothetical protein